MTSDEVATLMRTSATEAEWNANCDKVKAAFGGQYPPFWYATVILSGLAAEVSGKFTE